MPKATALPMTISAALVNTTDIPGAVPNTTTISAAHSAGPFLGSAVAAVLLAAMLL